MLGTWVIELTVKFPIIYIIGDDKIWTSLRQRQKIFYKAPRSERRESLLSIPSDAGDS